MDETEKAIRSAGRPVAIREWVAVPFKGGEWGMLSVVHIFLHCRQWRCSEDRKQQMNNLVTLKNRSNFNFQSKHVSSPSTLCILLFIWTEITQLQLPGCRRRRLLLLTWLSFVLSPASLLLFTSWIGAGVEIYRDWLFQTEGLAGLCCCSPTSGFSAPEQRLFCRDRWGHQMGWNNLLFQRKKIHVQRATIDNSAQFYSYYVGKIHIILLRLLDKEGLSIVSKLHV